MVAIAHVIDPLNGRQVEVARSGRHAAAHEALAHLGVELGEVLERGEEHSVRITLERPALPSSGGYCDE